MFDSQFGKYVVFVAVVGGLLLYLIIFGDIFLDWHPIVPQLLIAMLFIGLLCIVIAGSGICDEPQPINNLEKMSQNLSQQGRFCRWLNSFSRN